MKRWRSMLWASAFVAAESLVGAWWNQIVGASKELTAANVQWHASAGIQLHLGADGNSTWFGGVSSRLMTVRSTWRRIGGSEWPEIGRLSWVDRSLTLWSDLTWHPERFDTGDVVDEEGVGVPFVCVIVTEVLAKSGVRVERRVWWPGAVADVVVIAYGLEAFSAWRGRRRRRLAAGLCGQCGYPIHSARCPECGQATGGQAKERRDG